MLAVLVLTNNPLLNDATNVAQCYSDLGEKVRIEVVTLGAGLNPDHGLRAEGRALNAAPR